MTSPTAAAPSEACYCGARWLTDEHGRWYCPHCDRPQEPSHDCVHCATARRWWAR